MMYLQRSFVLLLGLVALVLAREVPVRYYLEDGSERRGTFVKLAKDSVYLRIPSNDSSEVELVQYKLEFRRILQADNDSIVNLDLSDFVFPDPVVEEVKIEPPYPPGNAHIKVVSEPEACRLYINGKDLDVLTPYVIPNVKAGKYEIAIRKYLKDVDWWGSEKVKLKENETLTVKIKLQRPRTELSIITLPEAAEVFIDEEPSLNHMPDYYTDVTIKKIRPKLQSTLYFRKVGYHDTSVVTEIKPFTPNMVYVEMQAIEDNLAMFEMQNEYNAKRKKKWVGRGLLWSSIVPFLAGGTLWYFAERDWQKAADLKQKYNEAAFSSARTDGYIRDNKDYNDRGDLKIIGTAGFSALGLALIGTGIYLQF